MRENERKHHNIDFLEKKQFCYIHSTAKILCQQHECCVLNSSTLLIRHINFYGLSTFSYKINIVEKKELTIDMEFSTNSVCVLSSTTLTSPPGLHVEGIRPGHAVDSQCRAGGADREVVAVGWEYCTGIAITSSHCRSYCIYVCYPAQ